MKFPEVELPSNKKFGFIFSLVFLFSSIYFFILKLQIISYFLGCFAVLLIVVTLVNAHYLLPFNKLWMRFGFLLGLIISPIVLGIIFFGLITPYSIALRVIGRDELHLKKSKKKSHWKFRSKVSQHINFREQF